MRLPVIPAMARVLALSLSHVHAAALALAAAVAVAVAFAFLRRKRVTWSACLDMPVAVTSGQPARAGAGAARALLFGEHGPAGTGPCPPGTERAWLVVLGIGNHGLTPVRGTDFQVPLMFTFPGRRVQATQLSLQDAGRAASLAPRMAAAALPGGPGAALAGSHASCVQLGRDFLLRPGGRCSVMLLLTGDESLGITQGGSITGGTITRVPGDR